ncbi:DUF177 domain-containing protein [Bacillus lacus]|uniref:DUF177 domain-containing protein n=1 Tax=Metabacillus lacus TaxID=1983721 RepID=A0A7X2IX98_9BACI|nr:DUF177 domain-containing protein [Metabacillus lacus]MRX70828.1 DUF177 domain-containing protein [Metabacillus lacus]
MNWTVSQLKQFIGKGFELDETADLSGLVQKHAELRDISPVRVTGRADVGSTRVTFHLKIQGTMVLPCSRTLVDVPYPFNVQTTETFLLKPSDYEMDEEEVHLVNGDTVDLTPVLEEAVLLEIPIQVFSESVDQEGAAPQEGKDWKLVSEEENRNKIDPRLAGLAQFFDKDDESK